MLPSLRQIDDLAGRIESAYYLRGTEWRRGCSTSRVWQEAAFQLWRIHASDPAMIPLDPELYVASQPRDEGFRDPWSELACPAAARRFRGQVRRIVRSLSRELRLEVKRAERLCTAKDAEERLSGDERFSPLGCYIAAVRRDLPELAARFAAPARCQHDSCPLYRIAAATLIPGELYPIELGDPMRRTEFVPRMNFAALSLN